MPELISYDEDARQKAVTADILERHPKTIAAIILQLMVSSTPPRSEPWPICGDELTKRRLK